MIHENIYMYGDKKHAQFVANDSKGGYILGSVAKIFKLIRIR
jgi:hypothetical protein